jgi:hypothetical protein
MTGIAAHGRLALLVAIHTPFHLQRLLKIYDLLRRDIAVTLHALDLGCRMRAVTEEDKARQLVDQLQRDLSVSEICVAGLTLRQSRKTRPIRTLRIHVTEGALLLQRRVLLVIERPVVPPQTHAPQTQGKE